MLQMEQPPGDHYTNNFPPKYKFDKNFISNHGIGFTS